MTLRNAFLTMILLAVSTPSLAQQPKAEVEHQSVGHVVKPHKVEPTEQRIASLKVPDGLRVQKFAEGLGKPRMMVVSDDGTVYVSRRDAGDVLALNDRDGDGRAESVRNVYQMPDAHGLAIHDGKLYIAAIHEVVAAPIKTDGALGQPQRILDGLPGAGQHPNRTIAFGPDGMMYLSIGSTCNACDEPEPLATLLRCKPDGSSRAIFARGLRNTIGFDWHPATGELWGMDHGIDWLGDEIPPEELNHLKEGANYGWPYLWGDNNINPSDDPAQSGKGSYQQWKDRCVPPALGYTSHAAPLQMTFYDADHLPSAYRNDAFVAMHGSWNRKPPAGYEVVRIEFDDAGKPVKFEPFLTGFLTADGTQMFGRPAGLAVAKDGSLLVGDDLNGIIYRIFSMRISSAEPPR